LRKTRIIEVDGKIRRGKSAWYACYTQTLRTVISWAENFLIFDDLAKAFRLSYLNKCDDAEHSIVAELYQRAIGEELAESIVHLDDSE